MDLMGQWPTCLNLVLLNRLLSKCKRLRPPLRYMFTERATAKTSSSQHVCCFGLTTLYLVSPESQKAEIVRQPHQKICQKVLRCRRVKAVLHPHSQSGMLEMHSRISL